MQWLRLLGILLTLCACMASDTYACSCRFDEQEGFIHAKRNDGSSAHLPANARGVLFLVTQYQMKSRPPLQKEFFSITEGAKKNVLKVAIQRMDLPGLPDDLQTVYRVGPEDGFQPGKTYTIRERGWRQMTVVIDGPLATSPTDRFEIILDGAPSGRALHRPAGGSCTQLYPQIVQDLRYSIPQAYAPYNYAMLYFTYQQSGDSEANPSDPKSKLFTPHAYTPSLCSLVPYGGSNRGLGRELVFTGCQAKDSDLAAMTTQVKGFVGLLEMDDQLHETPIVTVDFAKAGSGSCDVQPLPRDPIEIKGAETSVLDSCDIGYQRCL